MTTHLRRRTFLAASGAAFAIPAQAYMPGEAPDTPKVCLGPMVDTEMNVRGCKRFRQIGITHVGGTERDGVELELRSAIEPWHVLGDDSSSGAAARYVDSSTERLQVSVRNFEPARHLLACNGLPVPLVAAGTPGYYVAGVRSKAWKPWS